MQPTEKHIAAAVELVDSEMFKALMAVDRIGKCAELVAVALANAEREGMKRAAEIARKRIVGGHMHGSPEWPDGDDIATAILSEAGEGGQ